MAMSFNQLEVDIMLKLQELKDDGKYIALSLHPAIGNSTISKEDNRMFINEGRNGKWDGIREEFYDKVVDMFDSRY